MHREEGCRAHALSFLPNLVGAICDKKLQGRCRKLHSPKPQCDNCSSVESIKDETLLGMLRGVINRFYGYSGVMYSDGTVNQQTHTYIF